MPDPVRQDTVSARCKGTPLQKVCKQGHVPHHHGVAGVHRSSLEVPAIFRWKQRRTGEGKGQVHLPVEAAMLRLCTDEGGALKGRVDQAARELRSISHVAR